MVLSPRHSLLLFLGETHDPVIFPSIGGNRGYRQQVCRRSHEKNFVDSLDTKSEFWVTEGDRETHFGGRRSPEYTRSLVDEKVRRNLDGLNEDGVPETCTTRSRTLGEKGPRKSRPRKHCKVRVKVTVFPEETGKGYFI